MGKILDAFRKMRRPYWEAGKGPGADQDVQGHLEHERESRKRLRAHNFAKSQITSLGLSGEQIRKALKKSLGDKEYETYIKSHESSSTFQTLLLDYLRKHRDEYFQGMEKQEADRILQLSGQTLEHVRGLMESGIFPRKVFNDLVARAALDGIFTRDREEKFVEALENELTDNQKKKLEDSYNNYKELTLTDPEKLISYPYSEKIASLKQNIPPYIANEPDKKKEYEKILEFSEKHLTELDDSMRLEYREMERDVQSVEAANTRRIVSQHKPKYKNGVYQEITQEIRQPGGRVYVVNKEKEKAVKEMLTGKMILSEATKKGIKEVINKMKDMKLLSYPHSEAGEDDNKVYAFNKLLVQKNELQDAINAGNAEQILKTGKAYKKTYEDMQQLFDIAKKHFSQDKTFFPGNMDSIRNKAIPAELTSDLMTTAQINNVFLIYMNLERSKRDVDDYLDNPTGVFIKDSYENFKPHTYEEQSKKVNDFSDLMDLWTNKGKFKDCEIQMTLNAPIYGFARSIAGPIMLEKDQTLLQDGMTQANVIADYTNDVITMNGRTKMNYLLHSCKTEREKRQRESTIANILVTADQDRDPNGLFADMPKTDMFGFRIGEAFDRRSYLESKPADYEGILKRCTIFEEKIRALTDKNAIKPDDAVIAMQKAIVEVLSVKKADRSKDGYRQLALHLFYLPEKLSADAPKEQKDWSRAVSDSFMENYLPELVIDRRAEAAAASLKDADNAAREANRNVHMGSSQYKTAMAALDKLREEYEAYNRLAPATPGEVKKEKLTQLKDRINEVNAAIERYFKRKKDRGEMDGNADEKSERRIAAMKQTQKALEEAAKSLFEREKLLDEQIKVAQASDKIKKGIEDAGFKDGDALHNVAATGADKAITYLNNQYQISASMMTESQQELCRDALATVVFYNMVKSGKYGNPARQPENNEKACKEYIKSIAQSGEFESVLPREMNKAEIGKFLTDENSLSLLTERYIQAKQKGDIQAGKAPKM